MGSLTRTSRRRRRSGGVEHVGIIAVKMHDGGAFFYCYGWTLRKLNRKDLSNSCTKRCDS
jgi:hypothetical protein